MSALDDLRQKIDKDPLENAVALFADYELEARKDGRNIIASLAAAELAAMQAVIEAARKANDSRTLCTLDDVMPLVAAMEILRLKLEELEAK